MNAMQPPGPLAFVDCTPGEPEDFELAKRHHTILRDRQLPNPMCDVLTGRKVRHIVVFRPINIVPLPAWRHGMSLAGKCARVARRK